ncbi:hypothetical protein DOTSEDRAFT_33031 [Dothistroma septosporum NZE10]|uniref:Uncharacterized protein n=1 Tax=Dothistroma septosporum (strain NZE10 / CBS 128990) TaxID=675120 RepID=N1PTY9_DOTSN|nr:hypothetical protein DOTSEDRAFT_33031 [Dothistroma septosporum NZE10]
MGAVLSDQLTFRGLSWVLRLCCQARGVQELPAEIVGQIHYLNNPRTTRRQQLTNTTTTPVPEHSGPRGDPTKPPPTDIFTKVPTEIRMQIFAAWLPAKDVVVKPSCGSNIQPKDPKRKPKRNKTSDMMIVCNKIKDEMIACCYEERTFAIHIHEGLTTGGVEACDAGRQPLQYQTSYVDDRFTRFSDNDEFGFKRLRKIEITFFPTSEDARFTTINTYFMSRALAGLFKRGGEKKKNRIVLIVFKFAKGESAQDTSDRRSIMAREHRWWDPDNNGPRSTALGFMSDIELVLRPFAILEKVHNVRVELPPGAESHAATVQFVSTLVARMTGSMFAGGSATDYDLHDQAEQYVTGKRDQLEAEILEKRHGKNGKNIPSLSEDDFMEADEGQRRERPLAFLNKSAREIAQEEEDLTELRDGLKPIRSSEVSSDERSNTSSRIAELRNRVLSGPGRRLGSSPDTADGAARRRLAVQPPASSLSRAAAMKDFREQNGIGSSEDTATPNARPIMPEDVVPHHPRASLSSPVNRESAAPSSLENRMPEFGYYGSQLEGVEDEAELPGQEGDPDMFDPWG